MYQDLMPGKGNNISVQSHVTSLLMDAGRSEDEADHAAPSVCELCLHLSYTSPSWGAKTQGQLDISVCLMWRLAVLTIIASSNEIHGRGPSPKNMWSNVLLRHYSLDSASQQFAVCVIQNHGCSRGEGSEAMGFTQPLTEMSTISRKIIFLASRARPVRRDDNLTAICEPTV
jgi:hypothetical protein